MLNSDKTPTFNLKVVVRETGLKPDTLRAWERRYGLPEPDRTSGGHRLYSQHDIDTLKWLLARQDEGLSISRAVDLWRQMETEGQDPLKHMPVSGSLSADPIVQSSTGEILENLQQDWLSACLNFDETEAEQILNQAFALYPVETVCIALLQTALSEIGENWYQGEVSVQQEHFASALAMRRLEALLAASPPPTRSGRVLLGCPPEEEHIFVPLLLTLFLRRRGWHVVYLGASVPVARMQMTIASVNPNLVLLSAQRLTTAATLREMALLLQEEGVPLAYGGRIFNQIPDLQTRVPGHFLGDDTLGALKQIETWLTASRRLTPVEPAKVVPDIYLHALSHFQERRGMIEAEIWQLYRQTDLSTEHLLNTNQYMARNIIAALQLGSMALLNADITWVEGLLEYQGMPASVLHYYFTAYAQAARHHLGEAGQLIVDWLTGLAQTIDEQI